MMIGEAEMAQQKKRRKGWIVGSCALVLVAFGGIGYMQYAKTALAKQAYYRRHDVKYGVKIYSATSEAQAGAAREKYLAQALKMRDKWKPWAEQHRDLLTRMRHAEAGDLKTLTLVYDTLPNRAGYDGERGITQEDLINTAVQHSPEFLSAKSTQDKAKQFMRSNRWIWCGFKPPTQHFNDPVFAANYEKSMRSGDKMIRDDFDQNRDFALLRSMGASRSRFIVWASGHITESTKQLDGSAYEDAEIASSYDFLR